MANLSTEFKHYVSVLSSPTKRSKKLFNTISWEIDLEFFSYLLFFRCQCFNAVTIPLLPSWCKISTSFPDYVPDSWYLTTKGRPCKNYSYILMRGLSQLLLIFDNFHGWSLLAIHYPQPQTTEGQVHRHRPK